MENFNLKKFLIENKLTTNSRILEEGKYDKVVNRVIDEFISHYGEISNDTREEFKQAILTDYEDAPQNLKQITLDDAVEIFDASGLQHEYDDDDDDDIGNGTEDSSYEKEREQLSPLSQRLINSDIILKAFKKAEINMEAPAQVVVLDYLALITEFKKFRTGLEALHYIYSIASKYSNGQQPEVQFENEIEPHDDLQKQPKLNFQFGDPSDEDDITDVWDIGVVQ
jgi:hypothetical protein